jgi:hypothetical protein
MTSVAALESVGGGMRAAERSRHAIEAEALATSELEFMNMLTDRELQALPDSVSSGKFPVPMDAYTWTASSTPVAEQAGVYDVRVIVKWDEGTYTLRSYQYRLPPLVTRR